MDNKVKDNKKSRDGHDTELPVTISVGGNMASDGTSYQTGTCASCSIYRVWYITARAASIS